MNEPRSTLSFWIGLGCFVFGVLSIIGQDVWEAGRMWGEFICEEQQP